MPAANRFPSRRPASASDLLVAPAAVRAAFARGVSLVRAGHGGRGLRPDTVWWAEQLAVGAPIDRGKAKDLRAWFLRHGPPAHEAAARAAGGTTPAAVAWALWGGRPSIPFRRSGWRDPVAAWSRRLAEHFALPGSKPNGTTELALAAVMGAGAVGHLAHSIRAEWRAKALDARVVRALAPWRLAESTRIAPPRNGTSVSTAPRLRDLADRSVVTPAWDARKRELIEQASVGDVSVFRDAAGVVCLAPPVGGPAPLVLEPSRRFRATAR